MFKTKIKSRYRKNKNARLYQGDILRDLEFIVGDPRKEVEKSLFQLPFSIILTQDCDLESDYKSRSNLSQNQDKFLLSLLICPAFNVQKFSQGEHFPDLQMETFNTKEIDKLKKNDKYKRYHFLPGNSYYSLPDLVIDFKHFFTLPREFVYQHKKEKYLASLNELFREELSQRFSNYLSRIGLPEIE